eukprot:gene8990-1089_t
MMNPKEILEFQKAQKLNQHLNIQHNMYQFPIDRDVKINIFASNFQKLFSSSTKIYLPVFQRRYCWNSETSQLQRWWKDVSTPIYNKHQIGKFIFFETSDGLLCVDGQQRCSTTLIILSSIRDSLNRFDANDKNVSNIKKEINSFFFEKGEEQFEQYKYLDFKEGEQLRFIKFTPTFLDRKTFYQIILQREIEEKGYLWKSKTFFDDKFSSLNLNRIVFIYQQLLNDFAFVNVGLPDSQLRKGFHIYQWFFEKSLGVEKIFEIKSPGIKHTVQELSKNFLLSFFIDESFEKQNQIYVNVWLEIEKLYSTDEFHQYVLDLTKSDKIETYDIYRDFVDIIEKKLSEENDFSAYIKDYMLELIKKKK